VSDNKDESIKTRYLHDFDTMAILIRWRIWKERNVMIFHQEYNTVDRVFEMIIEEIQTWRAAGCIIAY
jgi:hypothetical protein